MIVTDGVRLDVGVSEYEGENVTVDVGVCVRVSVNDIEQD